MLNSCTRTKSGTRVNLFDTMNENKQIHSSGIINIPTQFRSTKSFQSVCGCFSANKHTSANWGNMLTHTHTQPSLEELCNRLLTQWTTCGPCQRSEVTVGKSGSSDRQTEVKMKHWLPHSTLLLQRQNLLLKLIAANVKGKKKRSFKILSWEAFSK